MTDPLTKLLSREKHDHTLVLFGCQSHSNVNYIIDSSKPFGCWSHDDVNYGCLSYTDMNIGVKSHGDVN